MNNGSYRKITMGFRLAIGLMTGLCAASFWVSTQRQNRGQEIALTQEAIASLSHTARLQAEAEAQARDYLLTNRAGSHSEYVLAQTRAVSSLKCLGELARDEPELEPFIADLQGRIGQRQEMLDDTITRHQAGDGAGVRRLLLSDDNTRPTHQIGMALNAAMRHEARQLETRQLELHGFQGTTGLALLGLTGLLYALLIAGYVTVQHDTRTLVGETVRLREQAATDGLTGLKNHRAFQEKLDEEFTRSHAEKTPLSLLLMDVDWFKAYNDTFGHRAGDVVLQRVAGLLQMGVRQTDFVARYGGEEFVVVLPSTGETEAKLLAERLRALIATEPWPERPVTVSVGTACLQTATILPTLLVEQADQALYAAKSLGRNRCAHFNALALAS